MNRDIREKVVMSYLSKRLSFKVVSLAIALSFLSAQIIDPAFAQELRSSLSDKPFKTLRDEFGPGYSVDKLTNLNQAASQVIENKNIIEEYQYETKDEKKGVIAERLLEDSSERIEETKSNIEKVYEDFKQEIKSSRKTSSSSESSETTQAETETMTTDTTQEVTAIQFQDASIIEGTATDAQPQSAADAILNTLNNNIEDPGGLITQTTQEDDVIQYSYEKDSSGNITKIIISIFDSTWEFDKDGSPLRAIQPDGTVVNYSLNQISSIIVPNGKEYIYEKDSNNLATFTKVIDTDNTTYYYDSNYNIYQADRSDGTLISNIVLDSEGKIKDADIKLPDNTIVEMRARLITNVELLDKFTLSYTYIYDSSGNISKVNIARTDYLYVDRFDNLNLSYWTINKGTADTISGELILNSNATSYTILEGNESYERTQNPINIKADFKLDSSNTEFYFGLRGLGDSITGSALKSDPDQNKGNTQRFLGILQKDGMLYARYREGTGFRDVTTGIFIKEGTYYTIELEFDINSSLIYVYEKGSSRQNTPIYESSISDYSPYLYAYAKDGIATIDNLKIIKESSYSFDTIQDDTYYSYLPLSYKESYREDLDIQTIQYDTNDNVIEIKRLDGTIIHYLDNRVDRITLPDGRIINLTHEVTPEGDYILTIENVATNETRIYKNGILQQITNYLSITTSFEYDEEAMLTRLTMTKEDVLLHEYTYTYDNNLIIVTDETGTKRTYDSATNQLIKIELSGGAIINYENGKIRQIVDSLGNIIADYIYNTDGNLEKVTLVSSRERLALSVEEVELSTLKERDDALLALDKAVQDAIALVEQKYAEGLSQAQAERQRLYSIGSGYDISQALADVSGYEEDLKSARDQAILDIENERIKKTQEVLTKTEDVLNYLLSWEANTLNLIIYQEISALLDTYYKDLLGRAPSDDEMTYWQDRALSGEEVTGTLVSSYLESSQERMDKLSQGQSIIDKVKEFLYSFLDMSLQEKKSALSTLGLTITQVVNLTKETVDSIISWLTTQSLYIVNCASEALYNLLTSLNRNDISKEEITTQVLLIDVLTGVIGQYDIINENPLSISMYAIQKAASLKGLDLTGAKVSIDTLKELTSPFIANLDLDGDIIGDHFVVVTSITDTTVTYIDFDGKSYSIPIENFNTKFTGYILSPEKEKLQDDSLSAYLLMNVKGNSYFVGPDLGYFDGKWYDYTTHIWHFYDGNMPVEVIGDSSGYVYNNAIWVWITEGSGRWRSIPDFRVYVADGRWESMPVTPTIPEASLPLAQATLDSILATVSTIGQVMTGPIGIIGTAVKDAIADVTNAIIAGIEKFLSALAGALYNKSTKDIIADTYEPWDWISPSFWPSQLDMSLAIRYKGGFNLGGGRTLYIQKGIHLKIGPFEITIPLTPWVTQFNIEYPWYYPAVITTNDMGKM